MPGGPLDQLVGDPDVSTFLNERFEARFLALGVAAPDERTLLLDPSGCLLPSGEIRAAAPQEWIGAVNRALTAARDTAPERALDAPDLQGIPVNVADRHPLASPCASAKP
ncbi:MAG: hypothetical protein VX265_11665 [Myxococcota bacterium]|nr:hypothetical protein [Myxococcota bacterium]MEC8423498.1 hypothetical protein [Myxococcota bacterium]